MKSYQLYLPIVVLFNYLFLKVLAENDYYIISIRRNSADLEYDKANENVQNSIDELVNDRMNDIYEIIAENKENFEIDSNGQMDEKLNELTMTSQLLKKRSINGFEERKVKFRFINNNRPAKNNNLNTLLSKRNVEYIPIESDLVKHICPVSNYYTIIAYLSENLVDKVKALPNVISCSKPSTLNRNQGFDFNNIQFNETISDSTTTTTTTTKYYDEEKILEETHWSGLSVQEHKVNKELINTHLSLISQGRFNEESTFNATYDNNYYYPSSAGKGIDIYVLDGGIDPSLSKENFDTYEGTPDERVIKCDGIIYRGQFKAPVYEKSCNLFNSMEDLQHGNLVSISAAGALNGVAKKANLHMIATYDRSYDYLVGLDYVKQHANPKKTVVNISSGFKEQQLNCDKQLIQDKINELVELGFIIFVSGGNTGTNTCTDRVFANIQGVIPIGAINNKELLDKTKMEKMYEIANYSSFGECMVVFAPGTVRVTNKKGDIVMFTNSGTSFASPMAAGVAATIMAENPDITFNYETMKNKLIELSIKNVIQGLDDVTPNRLINNGKRSIYEPLN